MGTRKINVNSNPQLLDLLKMGATVILPDGRYLSGDTESGYVSFGVFEGGTKYGSGCYNLNREGLRNTIGDADFVNAGKTEE